MRCDVVTMFNRSSYWADKNFKAYQSDLFQTQSQEQCGYLTIIKIVQTV